MGKIWAGALGGMLLLAGGAARAERPKILVLPVTGKAADAAFRARVAEALSEGLIASGGEVVAKPSGPAALPAEGCTTPACLSGAARATGAAYLLRAAVEEEGRSYTFKLEMLDGQSGAVLAQRENRCEICTDAEALEIANAAASALKAQALKKSGGVPPPGPTVTPVAAPEQLAASPAHVPAPTTGASATPGSELATGSANERSSTRTAMSWVSVGIGVAAIAAGSVLMYINDRGTCTLVDMQENCRNQYQTKTGGIALLGAGVLIGVTGVWSLAF
jgi:hypothetical protein